jgi:hypothetical protein
VGENPSGEEPRRPRRLWLRVIGVLFLLLVVGVLIRLAVNYRLAQTRLQAAVAEVDATDSNWRLDQIEQTRADLPSTENSAHVVMRVKRLLRANWLPQSLSDALDQVPPQEQLGAEPSAQLATALDNVGPALREARKVADLPRGRYPIEYTPNPISTRLDDQQNARAVFALLAYDARRLAQAGDLKGAMTSCRAALNAARSLGDEPMGISQLIRTAGVAVACREVERVLAQGAPAEEDLAALQRLLEDEDRFPTLLVTLRGERAIQHELFRRVERGEATLGGGSGPPMPGLTDFFGWGERSLLRYEQPFQLSSLTRRVEAARLPLHEQSAAIKTLAAEEARSLPRDAILTGLMLPAVDKMCNASWRKHAQIRCLAVLLATERFRQANGRWPAKLEELTPRFLEAVPADPYDGKPLRYRKLTDGVVVYSVGEDRVDDGGVLDRRNPTRSGADLGYQLWNVERRRQPPGAAEPAKKGDS